MVIVLLVIYVYLCYKRGALLTWRPFFAALKRMINKGTAWCVSYWENFHFISAAAASQKIFSAISPAVSSASKNAAAARSDSIRSCRKRKIHA